VGMDFKDFSQPLSQEQRRKLLTNGLQQSQSNVATAASQTDLPRWTWDAPGLDHTSPTQAWQNMHDQSIQTICNWAEKVQNPQQRSPCVAGVGPNSGDLLTYYCRLSTKAQKFQDGDTIYASVRFFPTQWVLNGYDVNRMGGEPFYCPGLRCQPNFRDYNFMLRSRTLTTENGGSRDDILPHAVFHRALALWSFGGSRAETSQVTALDKLVIDSFLHPPARPQSN
jgi:hypothetical protein